LIRVLNTLGNSCLVKPFVDEFFCLLLYRYMSGIAIPLPMALQLTNASQQVRWKVIYINSFFQLFADTFRVPYLKSLFDFILDNLLNKQIHWLITAHNGVTHNFQFLKKLFSHLCTKYIKNTQRILWWRQTQLQFVFLYMGNIIFFV
jgi:hypothetical protein